MGNIREYEEDGKKITEYLNDKGEVVSRIEETIIDPSTLPPPTPQPIPKPTVEERIERIELTSAQTQVQGDYVAFLVETLLAK